MNERQFKKEFATLLRNAMAAKNDMIATPATPGEEKSTSKSGNGAGTEIGSKDDMYDSEESEEEEYLDDDDEDDGDEDELVDEGPDLKEEILRTIGPPNSLEFEHVKSE